VHNLMMCLVRCMRAASTASNRAYIHTKLIVWLLESSIQPGSVGANDMATCRILQCAQIEHTCWAWLRACSYIVQETHTSLIHIRSNTYKVRPTKHRLMPCLVPKFYSQILLSKKKILITSKCRHMYVVLNVDGIKN
jgi:hypothetical protein